MKWGDFKKAVEASGVDDDADIGYIDIHDHDGVYVEVSQAKAAGPYPGAKPTTWFTVEDQLGRK